MRAAGRTFAVDVAGFAGHAAGGAPLLPGLSDELAEYIAQKKLARPIVVGHMFGGTVAFGLAMARSDLLGGVLAVDAPPSRPRVSSTARQ